ncbi:MAG: TerB family tellurite resistance protein, partial [Gammaproteobacteria bacterium]|nr:TerB family tellurite resistance protein [Gammaproteobacteria bacterium]
QFAAGDSTPVYAADNISVTLAAPEISEAVGQLNQASLDSAVGIISAIDPLLGDAAHDAWASRGLIYAMLLDADDQLREQQLAFLHDHAETGVPEHVHRLQHAALSLDEPRRLTLVEMAMPALKELSDPQYRLFMNNTVAMIKSDGHVDLFEWVLHRLLVKELRPHFDGPQRISVRYRSVAQISDNAVTLLSALARDGHHETDKQITAFRTGMEELELVGEFDSADDDNFTRLNEALKKLRALKPLAKPRLIKACAAVVLADGHVSGREGAMLRGIAATLDCPLPPSIYHTTAGHD